MPLDLKAFARLGATARLTEISAERAEILKRFPDLKTTVRGRRAAAAVAPEKPKTRKRRFSAEQREAARARMKAYWQAKRKASE